MSDSRLVPESPDLGRLASEGYALRIQHGHLFVDDVPFVGDDKAVYRGTLVCPLDLQGGRTTTPSTHIMWFIGGTPRDHEGREIVGLVNPNIGLGLADSLSADCGFSQKPARGHYDDYHEKVTYYAAMIVGHAQVIDPTATPLTFRPIATDEDDSVFRYVDTFSSRAGIVARSQQLAITKVVIVGLGGTGAYILDMLAKVPIRQIHLYDPDRFATHNAFRAPGAASIDDLNAGLTKVEYHAQKYDAMRRGIVPHPVYVAQDNVGEILDADFVFLAVDASDDKKAIVEALIAARVPFVDTGIGVSNDEGGIGGQIRITTGLPGHTEHITSDNLFSYTVGDDLAYESNVQIAELNALAAIQAVIKFKKTLRFYADQEHELNALYRVDTNEILTNYGDTRPADDAGSAPRLRIVADGAEPDNGEASA